MHEHAEPVGGGDAAGAGRGEQRRLHRVVHGVDHELARVEPFHGRPGPSPPASRAAWRSRPGRTPRGRTRRARRRAAPGTRPAAGVGRRPSAGGDRDLGAGLARARARSPGPRRRRRRRARRCRAGSTPSSRTERRKPSPSVDEPCEPPVVATVTTCSPHRARPPSGVSSSHAHAASGLVRHRDVEAARGRGACTAFTAVGRRARAAPGTRRTPSRDRPPERGVVDRGRPRMPDGIADDGRRAVVAPVTVTRRSPRAARMFASCSAERRREVVLAVLAGHVEEVRHVGGCAAARSDCSVTVMIGVGGSPATLYVLYGESICLSALVGTGGQPPFA